jgi:phage shock protein C
MRETLYRIPSESKLFGVCAGLAKYFNLDVTLIRVIFVVLAFASGGIIVFLYLVLAIVLPEQGRSSTVENKHKKEFSFEEKVQDLGREVRKNHAISRFRNYMGVGLIVFGVLLLLQQIFPGVFSIRWDYVWPVFLIIIGLMVVARRSNGR